MARFWDVELTRMWKVFITPGYWYRDAVGEPGICGDLDRDGEITTADAATTLEIAAGSRPCDAATLVAADVDGDGVVTSLDALMILKAAAGAIDIC
ncbi:MAG: dockerin type I repeat-containing protein [Euryarchaeota archaeon]|nr:dockerin type I repeat-containing protein [Euryarchaeota archaeon]